MNYINLMPNDNNTTDIFNIYRKIANVPDEDLDLEKIIEDLHITDKMYVMGNTYMPFAILNIDNEKYFIYILEHESENKHILEKCISTLDKIHYNYNKLTKITVNDINEVIEKQLPYFSINNTMYKC